LLSRQFAFTEAGTRASGREVTELDGILNELSARDSELRGEEKTQSGMKKS
jgi:hypothetical protein